MSTHALPRTTLLGALLLGALVLATAMAAPAPAAAPQLRMAPVAPLALPAPTAGKPQVVWRHRTPGESPALHPVGAAVLVEGFGRLEYRDQTGAVLGRTRTDGDRDQYVVEVDAVAGVVILQNGPKDPEDTGITAPSLDTGARLWSAPTSDSALLTAAGLVVGQLDDQARRTMSLLDLRTGVERWRRDQEETASGDSYILDPANGRVLDRDLDRVGSSPAVKDHEGVSGEDITQAAQGIYAHLGGRLHYYRPGSRRPRWTIPIGPWLRSSVWAADGAVLVLTDGWRVRRYE